LNEMVRRQMKAEDAGRIRILVVEDEPVVRRVCERVLEKEGFLVQTAENGKAALEMLASQKFDACVLDFRMPGMDGRELFQYLESNQPDLAGRAVLATGDIFSPDALTFLRELGRPFLAKPFTSDELRTAVRNALGAAIFPPPW